MITTIPFSSYQIIPAEKIIRNNIHLEHVGDDFLIEWFSYSIIDTGKFGFDDSCIDTDFISDEKRRTETAISRSKYRSAINQSSSFDIDTFIISDLTQSF